MNYAVRAAEHGMPCPREFIENAHFAALGEVPAHNTKYRIASRKLARFVQNVLMSVMKRIEFTNNSTNFHFKLYNRQKLLYNYR